MLPAQNMQHMLNLVYSLRLHTLEQCTVLREVLSKYKKWPYSTLCQMKVPESVKADIGASQCVIKTSLSAKTREDLLSARYLLIGEVLS